jgi:hypothetical protein
MLDLNNFELKDVFITDNWNDMHLCSTDLISGRKVIVAIKSYAKGATAKEFPHATKENATENLEKFKNYLIEREIDTSYKGSTEASHVTKRRFMSCFSHYEPYFSNE